MKTESPLPGICLLSCAIFGGGAALAHHSTAAEFDRASP